MPNSETKPRVLSTSSEPWPCNPPSRALRRQSALPLPSARSRRKAELRAEIALDGLHLFVSESEILHVPERFTILGTAKIFHKCLVAVSDHLLQFKPFYQAN